MCFVSICKVLANPAFPPPTWLINSCPYWLLISQISARLPGEAVSLTGFLPVLHRSFRNYLQLYFAWSNFSFRSVIFCFKQSCSLQINCYFSVFWMDSRRSFMCQMNKNKATFQHYSEQMKSAKYLKMNEIWIFLLTTKPIFHKCNKIKINPVCHFCQLSIAVFTRKGQKF